MTGGSAERSEPLPFVRDLISMKPTADGAEMIQKLFVPLLLLIQPQGKKKRLSAAVAMAGGTRWPRSVLYPSGESSLH